MEVEATGRYTTTEKKITGSTQLLLTNHPDGSKRPSDGVSSHHKSMVVSENQQQNDEQMNRLGEPSRPENSHDKSRSGDGNLSPELLKQLQSSLQIGLKKEGREKIQDELPPTMEMEDDSMSDFGPDVKITQGQHVSSPPHVGTCSCWNYSSTSNSDTCCERIVHANHKWGYWLVTHALFGASTGTHAVPGLQVASRKYHDLDRYFDLSGKRNPKNKAIIDYREVFVTRNWFR